jgi:hypothetical protein
VKQKCRVFGKATPSNNIRRRRRRLLRSEEAAAVTVSNAAPYELIFPSRKAAD